MLFALQNLKIQLQPNVGTCFVGAASMIGCTIVRTSNKYVRHAILIYRKTNWYRFLGTNLLQLINKKNEKFHLDLNKIEKKFQEISNKMLSQTWDFKLEEECLSWWVLGSDLLDLLFYLWLSSLDLWLIGSEIGIIKIKQDKISSLKTTENSKSHSM